MKQLKLALPVFMAAVVGFLIGFSVQKNQTIESGQKICTKIDTLSLTKVPLQRGATYVREFKFDQNDPFAPSIMDTLTVIDFTNSNTKPNLCYVKWTFNKWKDTSKFISTESTFLLQGLKRIK